MTSDVHLFPGVERYDIGTENNANSILDRAKGANMTTVIVLGYSLHKGWYFASSSPDMDRNLGMLSRAMHDVLHCISEDFISGEKDGHGP